MVGNDEYLATWRRYLDSYPLDGSITHLESALAVVTINRLNGHENSLEAEIGKMLSEKITELKGISAYGY